MLGARDYIGARDYVGARASEGRPYTIADMMVPNDQNYAPNGVGVPFRSPSASNIITRNA
jgi:hypothetical protein